MAIIYFVPEAPGRTSVFAKFFNLPAPGGGGAGGPARRTGGGGVMGAVFKHLSGSALFHALTHRLVDQARREWGRTGEGRWVGGRRRAATNPHPPSPPPNAAADPPATTAHPTPPLLQDNTILHPASRALAAAPRGWKDYWLATGADGGVAAWHRWLTERGGGGPAWDPAAPPAPVYDREGLLNHWERHTRFCPTCQAAVRRLDVVASVAAALVYGAAVVAVGAALAALGGAPNLRLLALAAAGAAVVALAGASARRAALRLRRAFFEADKLADE